MKKILLQGFPNKNKWIFCRSLATSKLVSGDELMKNRDEIFRSYYNLLPLNHCGYLFKYGLSNNDFFDSITNNIVNIVHNSNYKSSQRIRMYESLLYNLRIANNVNKVDHMTRFLNTVHERDSTIQFPTSFAVSCVLYGLRIGKFTVRGTLVNQLSLWKQMLLKYPDLNESFDIYAEIFNDNALLASDAIELYHESKNLMEINLHDKLIDNLSEDEVMSACAFVEYVEQFVKCLVNHNTLDSSLSLDIWQDFQKSGIQPRLVFVEKILSGISSSGDTRVLEQILDLDNKQKPVKVIKSAAKVIVSSYYFLSKTPQKVLSEYVVKDGSVEYQLQRGAKLSFEKLRNILYEHFHITKTLSATKQQIEFEAKLIEFGLDEKFATTLFISLFNRKNTMNRNAKITRQLCMDLFQTEEDIDDRIILLFMKIAVLSNNEQLLKYCFVRAPKENKEVVRLMYSKLFKYYFENEEYGKVIMYMDIFRFNFPTVKLTDFEVQNNIFSLVALGDDTSLEEGLSMLLKEHKTRRLFIHRESRKQLLSLFENKTTKLVQLVRQIFPLEKKKKIIARKSSFIPKMRKIT